MAVGSFSVDQILEVLRRQGMRITQVRRQLLEVLFEAGEPLTLNEIRDRAVAKGTSPDYATVFRMVSLLEQMRVVKKVNLQRACSYFELRDPARHYDHLVCTGCGKVVLLDLPCPVEQYSERLQSTYGFRADGHSLEFFGQCRECVV